MNGRDQGREHTGFEPAFGRSCQGKGASRRTDQSERWWRGAITTGNTGRRSAGGQVPVLLSSTGSGSAAGSGSTVADAGWRAGRHRHRRVAGSRAVCRRRRAADVSAPRGRGNRRTFDTPVTVLLAARGRPGEASASSPFDRRGDWRILPTGPNDRWVHVQRQPRSDRV